MEKLSGVREMTYSKGTYLVREGFELKNLFIILEGNVRVSMVKSDGKTLTFCDYRSSGIIGDIEFMLNSDRATTSVVAMDTVKCKVIPIRENREVLKNDIEFLNFVGRELADKLLRSSKSNLYSSLYTGEERVVQYFLDNEENLIVKKNITEISNNIGVSYRHVQRLLKSLTEKGLIEKEGRRYRIIDREKMMEILK